MAFFSTRVQLHEPIQQNDYDVLHEAMRQAGFSRRVTHQGKTYELPQAEYCVNSDGTVEDVKRAAMVAAAKANKRFSLWIIHAAGGGVALHGLKEVPTAISAAR